MRRVAFVNSDFVKTKNNSNAGTTTRFEFRCGFMYVDCSGAIDLKSPPAGQFMRTTRCEQGDILFVLTKDDAQVMAKELVGRELTDDEIDTVKQLMEWELEGWQYTLEDAIRRAVAVSNPWEWLRRELRGRE